MAFDCVVGGVNAVLGDVQFDILTVAESAVARPGERVGFSALDWCSTHTEYSV